MKYIKIDKKNMKALMISFLAGIVMLIVLVSFLIAEERIVDQQEMLKLTNNYVKFENRIHNFLVYNFNLMTGFSAYIQTFEQYNENDVYSYLGHLWSNNISYIRNIGILKDTTIVWNYPKTENQKSIGVDLSKVSSQAGSVLRIKKTLKFNFQGPVNLVQGGSGYILRIPIVKDGKYWGMVSVVLRSEKVKELFDTYARESNLKVVILDKSSNDNLVYGERSVLKQDPASFSSTFSGGEWEIYVVPIKKIASNNGRLLEIIAMMGLLLIAWIWKLIYAFVQMNEDIKKKNDSLNRDIVKDKLTGIYNRNYFDSRIIEETERANRYKEKLSMIFFDLDHFKKVNDTYGHGVGDIVLKEASAIVSRMLRTNDNFARWGGEEFAIVLPDTTLKEATVVAEKLRLALEVVQYPVAGKVTASFGVAEYITDEYIGSWFNRVDKELYFSKTNGRNRVSGRETAKNDASVQIKIKWKDEWLFGNDEIDREHIELLKYGNDLVESSYKLTKREETIEQVNYFINLIEKHFENEETILNNIGFDHLDEHMKVHKHLLEETFKLEKGLENNNGDPHELLRFILNEVLVGHLIMDDKNTFLTLLNKGDNFFKSNY